MYIYENPVSIELLPMKRKFEIYRSFYNTEVYIMNTRILLNEPIFVYIKDVPEEFVSWFDWDLPAKINGLQSTVVDIKHGLDDKFKRYNNSQFTSEDIWDMSLSISGLPENPSITLRNLKDQRLAQYIHDSVMKELVEEKL